MFEKASVSAMIVEVECSERTLTLILIDFKRNLNYLKFY